MTDEADDRSIDQLDEQEVEARKTRKSAKKQAAELADAYRALMKTSFGRRVMWDILSGLGVYQTPFAPGQQDLTYVNIGRQNAGIELLVRLNELAPTEYLLMQKENAI